MHRIKATLKNKELKVTMQYFRISENVYNDQ